MKFGNRGPSQRVLSLAVHPPLGDLPSAAFLFPSNKGPDSFLQCVISYFKCSLTQLSKSTDNTINTWYLCSSVTADPRLPSTPPLPESHPPPQPQGRAVIFFLRLATCSPSMASSHCPLTLMGQNHGEGNPTLLSESIELGHLLWCPHSPLFPTFYLAHLWSQFITQIPAFCFCR